MLECWETHARDSYREHLISLTIEPIWHIKLCSSLAQEAPWMWIVPEELYLFVRYLDICLHISIILNQNRQKLVKIPTLASVYLEIVLFGEVTCKTITRICWEDN